MDTRCEVTLEDLATRLARLEQQLAALLHANRFLVETLWKILPRGWPGWSNS